MKYEGELKVTFKGDSIDTITFPKLVESFPNKQLWHNYMLWETHGNDNKMVPLTQKAINNLDSVCEQFVKNGFVGCKKDGKRKLTSIKYVLQTSLDGYEFVKDTK